MPLAPPRTWPAGETWPAFLSMSGWIKWEKDLETDPRTLRMAKELKRTGVTGACHPVTVVCGALARLWAYADSHIRDDDTLDLGCTELDELLGVPDFCATMPEDWLREIDEGSVELPGFQEHNGVEAKKKALTQKRVATHRQRKRNATEEPCNAPALPDQTRPDQTRPKEEVPSEPLAQKRSLAAAAGQVFNHWKNTWGHPTAVFDDKRRKRIEARLRNFTPDQLCDAISGFRNSPWHCGTDPKGAGKVFDAIDTLLRDTGQVEEGIRLLANPPRAPPKPENAMDRFRRLNAEPNDRVIEHESEQQRLSSF